MQYQTSIPQTLSAALDTLAGETGRRRGELAATILGAVPDLFHCCEDARRALRHPLLAEARANLRLRVPRALKEELDLLAPTLLATKNDVGTLAFIGAGVRGVSLNPSSYTLPELKDLALDNYRGLSRRDTSPDLDSAGFLRRPCPWCNAAAGSPCQSKSGVVVQPHKLRRRRGPEDEDLGTRIEQIEQLREVPPAGTSPRSSEP